ncbi:MAG: hypothetical protein PHD55_10330 [Methanoregula sp.]|nr:hypothetical protein [Methanoregula sp.]
MNELLLILLGFAGVCSLPCSGALLVLGNLIDRFPTVYEDRRVRSLSSPVASTRLAVIVFWTLFVSGAWAVLQENRLVIIAGITTVVATFLFLLTAIVFSVAVLSVLRRQRAEIVRAEREAAIETARISLEKTAGVKIVLPVPQKTRPARRLSSSMIEHLLRQ